jgi:hypothetical protein
MKTYELLSNTGTWKEITFYQYTNAQLAFLNSPTTEENKDAKNEMIAEIDALSKLEVSQEVTEKLNAEYELQKSKLENLALDYEVKWASFTDYDGKFAGVIHYFNDGVYHSQSFFPVDQPVSATNEELLNLENTAQIQE